MSIAGVKDVVGTQRAEIVAPAVRDEESSGGFGAHLQDALADLERTTTAADNTAEGLVTGEVDIHEAMVAMEKADLVLRVAGTVRNKVIDAYQQLMQAAGG
jgi:flagellar hook-basal body complex protein FliE